LEEAEIAVEEEKVRAGKVPEEVFHPNVVYKEDDEEHVQLVGVEEHLKRFPPD
jgi:hypothetical protein